MTKITPKDKVLEPIKNKFENKMIKISFDRSV
jgi:hypothetical protein